MELAEELKTEISLQIYRFWRKYHPELVSQQMRSKCVYLGFAEAVHIVISF
jgi:hypothetical protein